MIELYSKVEVKTSKHGDVVPGQTGIVVEQKQEGWGVQIDGLFTHANDVAHKTHERRVIFFTTEELEEI
jgi:hydrogenase maturation factor